MGCSSSNTAGSRGKPRKPVAPTAVPFPLSAGSVPPGSIFAPDTVLRWELIQKGPGLPPQGYPVGIDYGGGVEFVARTLFGDGSLRPGRLSPNCNGAAHFACKRHALCDTCYNLPMYSHLRLQSVTLKLALVPVRSLLARQLVSRFASPHGLQAPPLLVVLLSLDSRLVGTLFLQLLPSILPLASAVFLQALQMLEKAWLHLHSETKYKSFPGESPFRLACVCIWDVYATSSARCCRSVYALVELHERWPLP